MLARILYEKSFNLKTISQGDFGHFRENNLIFLSKVAKIALKIVFKLKLFPYKIDHSLAAGWRCLVGKCKGARGLGIRTLAGWGYNSV